ncbi:MAG: hypothetical protein IT348_01555 [Candidatus Eisenbacteria bacterium]|nr:hypothetical protein [Candidatus Eisenbacteria bacterium]
MRSCFTLRAIPLALLLVLTSPPNALAEDQKGRGVADPKDPVLAPRAALAPGVPVTRPGAPLRLHTIPTSVPGRFESFTDQGRGLPPAPPTDRERAKLEAARVAVAAARARAGAALLVPPTVDPATPLHSVPAGKLEQLRLAKPGAVPADPALSGLPPVSRSRQLAGPSAPTARELEKLKATAGSPVTPEVKKETER